MIDGCGEDIDWQSTMDDGVLYFGAQIMHRPAFAVTDVSDLWLPHNLRGENLLIPGVPGRRPMPKRADETQRSIPIVIDGRVHPVTGDPHTNDRYGLRYNVKYIENTCCNFGDLVQMTLWLPGALDATGASSTQVEVKGIQVGEKDDNLWAAVIDINIPGGTF